MADQPKSDKPPNPDAASNAAVPDSQGADAVAADPVDTAFAAYLRGCDEGQLDSREDFLAQYPEISAQLKELIDAADLIGQMTMGNIQSPKSVHDPSYDFSVGTATPHRQPTQTRPTLDLPPQGFAGDDETVALHTPGPGESGDDPAVTLPMSNRQKGDPGPTLPFDLGDYLLLEVIGRGGMGIVYRAKQRELDRLVAVKMIRSGILAGEGEVKRFYTEAQAAARLHHPGIVSVHQFGQRAGHHFFSMEFVRGTDLQKKINGETLSIRDAARYVRDVARAIHHAHEKGVLHRDLKPANVLINESDQVLVTDFGLAKHMDNDSSVTGSGDAIGTPHYMAPEQAQGESEHADQQSDVYALGAILFAALTGRPPIVADTIMQTLVKVIHEPAPPVRSLRPDAPYDLQTIIAKCLEKQPSKRYESAAALADELDAFLDGRPIMARPRSIAIKAWHWLEGVPLVAALSGRRMLHSSDQHRRFQAGMLLLLLISPIFAAGLATLWNQHKQAMPPSIRIAGGLTNGIYSNLSTELAQRIMAKHAVQTEIVSSNGSLDNRTQLLNYQVDLAPLQATAINGDQLCVVAPLFYEVLYVLAKTESVIVSLDDIAGHPVAVGAQGSGSRATAELVFDSLNLNNETVRRVVMAWEKLDDPQAPDVAMICIGRGSPIVTQLLDSGRWRLIPVPQGIQIALQHPTLRPMTIETSDHPGIQLPPTGVPTLGTTAFLAARHDTPSELVTEVLHALYLPPEPCLGLIPRRRAAEWQGLAFHPAARKFYGTTEVDPSP
ncbi:Serine/threonine-protein kinase PrkC [Rubripirellula lacrimiformis]|uniref:non-specific serine/threonine protein kinase n=1 Tax=Rubripirellula lacrimiformis TaxID=1930273 RepID=A0A517N3Z5_9BACT|nr:serine/threonine-protein kinase [Rubripirellula lacrimiformis]QDT01869.1 Serine/threonine-protein kinase PrkC [Rubripirellula lacrimiformis]